MALHDIHYQRWQGRHQGIWRRRGAIALHGLRACLGNRWMRYLVMLAWSLALGQTMLLFVIGQLLVEDSLVVRWAATLRGGAQALVGGLAQWLVTHPEISVRTAENALFYAFSTLGLTLNIVVVLLAIPHLITRDLSSNALLVYASKALNRWDYLLGKFGTLLGLLACTWIGPALLAWLVGNLLAPKWHFFWHARTALLHTLLFTTTASLVLALLGLGVSALSAKERLAVGAWLFLWLVGNTLVPISERTNPWLQFLSFRHNLRLVAVQIYQPAADLERLQREIPVFGQMLREASRRRPDAWSNPKVVPACVGLALLGASAGFLLHLRTKTE